VLSFGIALAILVVGVSKAGITWSTTARTLAHTSLVLYALAFAVYYLALTADRADAHNCPSRRQGNKCGVCRACWNREVKAVAHHKH
jgi:hypothetical protein